MFPRIPIRLAVLALGLIAVFATPPSAATGYRLPTTHPSSSGPRSWAPVVLGPTHLPDLRGAAINRLAVWVYRDDAWHTIPWQVDERDATGYMAQGDGVFNAGDELVVMLDDLSERAPTRLPNAEIVSIVTVTDPLAPSEPGRVAYVARMAAPVSPPAVDYVQYDAATRRLRSGRYIAGLNAQWPGLDYLALNGSALDLLDRSKLRLTLNDCGYTCSVMTEEQLALPPMTPLKDGPVRVVLDKGGVAYRDWLTWRTRVGFGIFPERVIQVALRLDLSPTVHDARYSDVNRGGIAVDGVPDDVPAEPASPWQQIDHATGRLLSQYTVITPFRRLFTFYEERATEASYDTGDRIAWGDHGIMIDEPLGGEAIVDQALWALPPDTTLDGPALMQQQANPLVVVVTRPQFPSLYLPLIRRGQ